MLCSEDNESDTESTDAEYTWGGLGAFEYSTKGLTHALMHAPELVKTCGHHGACCTCVAEAGHKEFIKKAALFSRTYASKNVSQDGMLQTVQRQTTWSAVFKMQEQERSPEPSPSEADDTDTSADESPARTAHETPALAFSLWTPLSYTDGWSDVVAVRGRPPPSWGSTFLSKDVLITRNELITLLRTKLQMRGTWRNVMILATQLHWQCFGSVSLKVPHRHQRKVVGISSLSPGRRDFVRVQGTKNNTRLAAQVIMFIKVTGFDDTPIVIPECLRNPSTNTDSVVMAVVRWLSPHPQALLRDADLKPVCIPPFDINHALWKFSTRVQRRGYFSDNLFRRQLHLFPGSDDNTRIANAENLAFARYDLIQIETIDTFMNCTCVDNDSNTIMETITLPFVVK